MSRWKQLEDLEKNISNMTVEQLRKELAYFKQHVKLLSQPARKGAMKRVHKIEKVLNRKINE
jgi:hypothetical protein